MGYKGNAELNSRVIRISLIGYNKLKVWGSALGLTMAELVDKAIELFERELTYQVIPGYRVSALTFYKLPCEVRYSYGTSK